uniref:apiosidase-like domain-containing protein n=1 Tax=Polaribacter sp. TaxID=1920175 RepID=UPI003F6C1154
MINHKNIFKFLSIIAFVCVIVSCKESKKESKRETIEGIQKLQVSENDHYFQTEDGKPFFWLGDTGWLTFKKLN